MHSIIEFITAHIALYFEV